MNTAFQKYIFAALLLLCSSSIAYSQSQNVCSNATNPMDALKCQMELQKNPQYQPPKPPPKPLGLRCGENVDCNSHIDVVNKMQAAFSMLYKTSDPQASAYKDVCFEALQNVKTFPPHLQGKPAVYQPQFGACNAGLKYFKQQ